MKEKIKKIVICMIILVIAFLYSHIDKNVMIYDKNVDTSEYISTGVLVNKEISQEFVSQEDELDGINAKCTVIGDPSKIDIEYKIVQVDTGREIAGKVNADKISNSKFYKFEFEKISGCKGKAFVFTIRESGANENNGIAFHYEGKQEKNTQLNIDDQKVKGTMIIRTISHRFDVETFIVLLAFILYIAIFMKMLYRLFK